MPETDGYSIMEVSKDSFDVDTYKAVMSYFHPDGSWIKEPALTKEDIVQRIANYQATGDAESPSIKQTIQELQGLLEEAPDETEYEPFSFDEIGNEGWFYAYCRNQNNGTSSILAGQLNSNTFQFVRDSDEYWIYEGNAETEQEKKDLSSMTPSISVEDAQKVADQALRDLNADPNMLLSCHTKSVFYKNETATSAAWGFRYMRDCNGLQASFVSGWDIWKGSPDPVNAAPWDAEGIFIIVDDEGIAMFDTRGAGKHKSVLFKNVDLLPFDDILERIKQQLVYSHAYMADYDDKKSVVITDIKLASSLVNIKDRPDVGRLIPTWDVAYDFYETLKGEEEPFVYHCHIYLNAIDGSYIEPRTDFES